MYAILGDAIFESVRNFTSFDRTRKSAFAEHALINTKPRLQHTGDDLEEIQLEAFFHVEFCIPKDEIEVLETYRSNANVLTFVLGTGEFIGYFVITDLKVKIQMTDDLGNLFSATVSLTLKEHAHADILGTARQAAVDLALALAQNSPVTVPEILEGEKLPLEQIAENNAAIEANGTQAVSDIVEAKDNLTTRQSLLDSAKERLTQVNKFITETVDLVTNTPIVKEAQAIVEGAAEVQAAIADILPFIPLQDMQALTAKSGTFLNTLDSYQTKCATNTAFYSTRFMDALYKL